MRIEEVGTGRGAGYDGSKLSLNVINAGFNKSKSRYYPAEVLKRDYKIFEGAKMFADHATDAEKKARPEGSVNSWVASITKIWAESNGSIKAEAAIIDPQFKAKLAALKEAGLLPQMGISIRASGEATKKKVDGVSTDYVESLQVAHSVDFVSFAGAGGACELLESSADRATVTRTATKQQLVEGYRAMGLSEAEAKVAAGIEEALTTEELLDQF